MRKEGGGRREGEKEGGREGRREGGGGTEGEGGKESKWTRELGRREEIAVSTPSTFLSAADLGAGGEGWEVRGGRD